MTSEQRVDRSGASAAPRSSAWLRIADLLAQSIANGDYQPGQRLPAEHALALEFGVNRHTIRRSLDHLNRQGLVKILRGSGTYVEDFAVDLIIKKRPSHQSSLALAGLRGSLVVLASKTIRANAEQAQLLQIPLRSAVLALTVVGEVQGRPLHVGDRLFPLPRFVSMEKIVSDTGSISAGFRHCGVREYSRHESKVAARMPRRDIADHLRQPQSRPVLWVESVNIDENGIPIEFATTWFAGDRVKLTINHLDE